MAGAISAANIRLGADISGLLSGLSSASSSVRSFTYRINTDLTNAYRRADTANRAFRGGLTRLGNEIQEIGGKMSLIGTLPAIFAAGAAYKSFADLQKLKIGLEQYGESMETVKKLATLPNISIEGAAESLVQLRAVGVQSDLAQRAIRSFANALTAAGKSSTDLNPALANVVQMLSTGAVSAADVKELANRIPQARKALMAAFGTASGEELTKIGSEKVILGLIEQLEKIPPVAGGAGMDLEKFGDSAQFAAATLGETLDKTFGITDKINLLADSLGDLTDDFAALDPKIQTFTLSAAAMAVAVPAVTVAIGGMIKAAVVAAGALGVAAGTVGAVAAAVAVGGALIITYWDEIKDFLTETGVWTTLVDLAESTWGIISNTFKSVGAILTGDWSRLWVGLKNTVASAVNLLNTILFGLVKQIGLATGAIAQLIGADSLGKWIREKSHGLDQVLKQLKIAQQRDPRDSVVDSNDYGKQFAADDAQQKAWEAEQARLAKMKPAADAASMSINELNGRLAELKEAYNSLKPGEEDYLGKKSSIAKQVKNITALIDKHGSSLKDATKHVKTATEEYEKMSEAQFKIWQIDLASKWLKEQEAVKAAIRGYKELAGVTANLNVSPIASRGTAVAPTGDAKFDSKLASDKATDSVSGAAGSMKETIDKLGQIDTEYAKKARSIAQNSKAMSEAISASVQQAAAEMAFALGDSLGDAISGVGGGLKDLGSNIYKILGELLTNIGKALITYSSVIQGLKKAIEGMNGYVAIAAGVLAIAAGKALKNQATKAGSQATTRFAKGGFAYGEMSAIVGDNPNARFDPEMIAPYSKVDQSIKKSIAESGRFGEGGFVASTSISARELLILIEREQQSRKGLTGI